MPRRPRFIRVGLPHHIVHRGNNKQKIFFDESDHVFFTSLIRNISRKCRCVIHAYCLMPNHVHILAVPPQKDSLSKMMQRISMLYAQHVNGKYERTGRLWESRFYSSIVQSERYLVTVCRYIERNPVRAKMVKQVKSYPWSSAFSHFKKSSDDFIRPIWNNKQQKKSYIDYLNERDKEEDVDFLRKATFSGRPFGNNLFITALSKELGYDLRIRPRGGQRKKRDTPLYAIN